MLTCYISSIISKSDMRCIIAQAILVLTQTHKDYFYVAHLTPKCNFFTKHPQWKNTHFFYLLMVSIVCAWYIPLCLGDGWQEKTDGVLSANDNGWQKSKRCSLPGERKWETVWRKLPHSTHGIWLYEYHGVKSRIYKWSTTITHWVKSSDEK